MDGTESEVRWPPLAQAVFEDRPEDIPIAVAGGADPNGDYGRWSYLELATFHGRLRVVEALIAAGARVPADALGPLGEMDITDYKIDYEDGPETAYAEIARLLLSRGASPHVLAYDGRPLIDSFPVEDYPTIYRVLSAALHTEPRPDA